MQPVLCGLLLGLLLPMAGTWPTNKSLLENKLQEPMPMDLSCGGFIAKRPEMLWATVIDREDRVIYGTGSSRPSGREASQPGSESEHHLDQSWRQLRDAVLRQRYKEETSLPFPEEGHSQAQP